jgi:hypothetical protein
VKLRIGGEFEVSASAFSQPCAENLPTPPSPYNLWVDTGRSALLLALREIVKQGGAKSAWLPAYVCSSVIAPFRELDFSLHFYSYDGSLGASQTMPLPVSGETFLFVHYFGKNNISVAAWLKEQRTKRDFFVIEDCVQASLNSNVGEIGDYVITSYRKFLPQPDGAMLGSRKEIDCVLEESDETFVSAKLVGKMLRQVSRQEELYLQLFDDAERKLEVLQPRKMSWLSSFMLQRTDIKKVMRTRRNNWRRLHERLAEKGLLNYLTPLFDKLAGGEVPLGLPVKVKNGDRDGLRRHLALQKIYCPVHWPLDHLGGRELDYPDEIALSRNMITLPIDQRLGKKHLEHMAHAISTYFNNRKL